MILSGRIYGVSWIRSPFRRQTEALRIWVRNLETKREIRRRIRLKRQELEEDVWRKASGDIAAAAVSHPWFSEAREIYTYVDYNREAGTRRIIETAFETGKNVWVPKVTGKTMHFYRIESLTELRPGTCGILEPAGDGPMDGGDAGLMLMPGVAFDEKCHRVGYGGGYYDRYLESHPGMRKMALAFEFQILRSVLYEEYDIRPEIVITEKRMIRNCCEREGESDMPTGLPKDPMLLLSVVNTKLRDYYPALDALCEDMDADRDEIIDTLREIGYEYDEGRKQFV